MMAKYHGDLGITPTVFVQDSTRSCAVDYIVADRATSQVGRPETATIARPTRYLWVSGVVVLERVM